MGNKDVAFNLLEDNLPEGWSIRKLSEVAEINTTSLKKTDKVDKIQYVDISSVSERRILQKVEYSFENAPSRARRKVEDGDTIISTVRPNLKAYAYIKNPPKNLVVSTGFAVVRPKKEDYKKYYYYYLTSDQYINYLVLNTRGSAYPAVDVKTIEESNVIVPTSLEAKKIGEILSAFDDKIELNNEMNKTLEEIAQAIFKHWFIDFEFPNENGEPYKSSGGEFVDSELGRIPKGWKVKSIGELVDFTISGDWGNDERSQDYDKKCFCIRGADFPPILRGDKTNIPVRFLKRSSFEKRRLKHGDILIEVSGGTKGRPTGRTVFVHRNLIKQFDESLVFSNFCRLIRVNDMLNSIILFLYLQFIYNKGKMTQYEIQSTGISNFQLKYFFENEKLAVAPIEIQEKFINLVEPIFDKKYTFENYYLSQLRDTLLPKLISGEIRVM